MIKEIVIDASHLPLYLLQHFCEKYNTELRIEKGRVEIPIAEVRIQ